MDWMYHSLFSPLTFQRQKCIFAINVVGFVDFFLLKYKTFIYANGGTHTTVTTQIFSNTQPGD